MRYSRKTEILAHQFLVKTGLRGHYRSLRPFTRVQIDSIFDVEFENHRLLCIWTSQYGDTAEKRGFCTLRFL
jgi:hypothetical protein